MRLERKKRGALMSFERLLGHYTSEETAFMHEVNQQMNRTNYSTESSESRGGRMPVGKTLDSKYSIMPDEELLREYRDYTIRSILDHVNKQ